MTLDMIDVVNMDTVCAYTGLACIYRDDEMYDEAIECHQSAIETAEQLSGAESFEIADEYNQIAITYRHMGELTRAIEYYQRAIELFEAQENVNRRKVARVLENLAMAYVYAEQMGNALADDGSQLIPHVERNLCQSIGGLGGKQVHHIVAVFQLIHKGVFALAALQMRRQRPGIFIAYIVQRIH